MAVLGWRRLGRLVAVLSIAETLLLSLPLVADALLVPLEDEARAAAALLGPALARISPVGGFLASANLATSVSTGLRPVVCWASGVAA